jgi:hypothetical protein
MCLLWDLECEFAMDTFVLLLFGAAPIAILLELMAYRKARKDLDMWAGGHGCWIIDASPFFVRLPWKPFAWRQGGYTFRVTTANARGETKSGYVYCPSVFLTYWGGYPEVEWDRVRL